MFYQPLGKPRPPGRVMLLSITTLMLHYGWYKWIIQEELRSYNGYGWSSSTRFLLALVFSVAIPQIVWIFVPDAPGWLGWHFLLVVIWIDIIFFESRNYSSARWVAKSTHLDKHPDE